MEKINIWDTELGSRFKYFKTFEELNQLWIVKGFCIKDFLLKGKDEKFLGHRFNLDNTQYTLTDDEHPIAVFRGDIIINSNYYKKNKEKIIELIHKHILDAGIERSVLVEQEKFSDDYLDILLTNEKVREIMIEHNVILSENQIKKIIKSGKRVMGANIPLYFKDKIVILSKINESDITEILQLKNGSKLTIIFENDNDIIFDVVEELADIFEKNNQKITIEMVNKSPLQSNNHRNHFIDYSIIAYDELFLKFQNDKIINSNLYKKEYKNVTLIINNGTTEYTNYISKYKWIIDSLKKILQSIIKENMSPFEKYMAIYNYVKNFKIYKENNYFKSESRNLKYILKDSSEYIVCVGYAKLMTELLKLVGIEAYVDNYDVDDSHLDGETLDNTITHSSGHARVYVNLIDEKYNINGYYISDPTFGNSVSNPLMFSILTKQKITKDIYMNYIKNTYHFSLIFTALNFDDFNNIINYILKTRFSIYVDEYKYSSKTKTEINHLALMQSYKDICDYIMEVFKHFDIDKFNEFKKNEYKSESEYIEFLSNVGHYIVEKNNCVITPETILKVDVRSKELQDFFKNDEAKNDYINVMLEHYKKYKDICFPIDWNENNKTK